MPSQYRLYPSLSQATTLTCQSRELSQSLSCSSELSLHAVAEGSEYKSSGGRGCLPTSNSNGSLINLDVDTSAFINLKSSFPWDDYQRAYHCTDHYQPVRSSFESSSSTIQGSYCSMKTPLLSDTNEVIVEALQSRQSILIPDYPQDLACHQIKAYKSRPADLRASSGDSAIRSHTSTKCSLSYKRSVTRSQLGCFAGSLGANSARRAHTPQRSFESNNTDCRPTTPSLSFSSTIGSSPASSIMSSNSELGDIPASVAANVVCAAVPRTNEPRIRSDARSPSPGLVGSGSKQFQLNISGPLPNADYPSMMSLPISPSSSVGYSSEGAFQPRCKTPKPPSSMPRPPSLDTPATLAEPPSWFDLDDDISEKPSKHFNLPMKLSIPHVHLRAESATKKNAPALKSATKRRSEENITIAAKIVEATYSSSKACSTNKAAAAHVSFPSSAPVLVQTKVLPVALKKKSSVRSKLLVPASGCTTKTSKKKKLKNVKVGSSGKKMRSPGRRLRAWFRRVFG